MSPNEQPVTQVPNISQQPSPLLKSKLRMRLSPNRTLHWMGGVNYENYLDITDKIKDCINDKPTEAIHLIVTSPGGPSGIGLSFYDMMRRVYHANLCTIGTGDVDSSGIIIFLSGKKRFLTPNTTLLLHLAGRFFDHSRRFTTVDMEYMMKEDKLKDYQYATVIAEESGGKLTVAKVLDLMANNTVLTPTEAVQLGLAHGII